jgi:hypothetical protein
VAGILYTAYCFIVMEVAVADPRSLTVAGAAQALKTGFRFQERGFGEKQCCLP